MTTGGVVLDTWYPEPALGEFDQAGTVVLEAGDVPAELSALTGEDEARGVRQVAVRVTIADLAAPPVDAHDAYLRLHLLSHRLVRPHGLNLDGVFGLLANVVWTNFGPCAVEGFEPVARRAARPRPGHRLRRRQVPADGRLRASRPACGSPTPTGSASARTWPRAPPSCTRAS